VVARRRARDRAASSWLAIACAAIGVAWFAVSCLDLTWKEGIACDGAGHCPGSLLCCDGICRGKCAERDAGNVGVDGPPVITCPVEVGGCFACMPGCPCTCGATHGTCCLQIGVATCAGCP
jgi:hypothetical protein